jgi:hypothetical protein
MVDEPSWLSLDPRLLALLKYEIDPRLRAEIERCRKIGQQVAARERRMAATRARPKSKRGRPKDSGGTVASDRKLYPDVIKLIGQGHSVQAAALKLAFETDKVEGGATQKSRATRLAKRFRKDNPGV